VDHVTDPALDGVVIALLTGSGIAIAVVLLMLGVARLVRRRPHPVAAPVEATPGESVEEQEAVEEPAGAEAPEAEVPAPREPAEAPAAEVVAAKPLSRKIPA
jgi:hypothetical protein